MASHRKPRTPMLQSTASGRGAVGVTTAALASVTLLSHTANAAPSDDTDATARGTDGGRPSVEEVRQQVDTLYRQAGSATQKYNAAKEKTETQRAKVERMLDQLARRTGELNDARRLLGNYATAQYRSGGMSETATLLLTENPQGFFRQTHLLERVTGRQKQAVESYEKKEKAAGAERREASRQLASLADAQKSLRENKQAVQSKLAEARGLLSRLTAEEKARLAAIERRKEAEARRQAAERARAEAEQRRREQAREQDGTGSGSGAGTETGSGSGSSEGSGGGSGSSYAAKAEKVLAFAEQQLGKPYVWGATGPGSYDCSGFTQDAWKAAGISLPRTTYDQVKVGTRVARSELRPGDLVFFYDDVSHVGIYTGDGQMIHASKPGDDVKYESVDYMPFHSAVRPA